MKAMIFAAGLGTRFKPLTDTMPKALVNISGKPLLEHVILKLKEEGFREIIVNVHHFGEQIIQFLKSKDNFGIRIEISDERDRLLDTGGAIKKAAWFFEDDESILIHNSDILSDVNLAAIYNTHIKNKVAGTLVVNNRNTSRYLFFDKQNHLKGWINEMNGQIKSSSYFDEKVHKKLAFFGIHVLSRDVVHFMDKFPDKFSIIDLYLSICDKVVLKAYVADNNTMVDVGRIESIPTAEEFLKSRILL